MSSFISEFVKLHKTPDDAMWEIRGEIAPPAPSLKPATGCLPAFGSRRSKVKILGYSFRFEDFFLMFFEGLGE